MQEKFIRISQSVFEYLDRLAFAKYLKPQELQKLLKEIQGYLRYLKQEQLSKKAEETSKMIFAALKNPKFNPQIAPYFEKINPPDQQPFTDYDLDPDNVSQIKKLLNALYHARLALLDVEDIELQDSAASLAMTGTQLVMHTVETAYQACYLATHLDIDLQNLFHKELQPLLPVLTQLQTLAMQHGATTQSLISETVRKYPLDYKAGEIVGITLEQMQPDKQSPDYNFLTQFGAILPTYINKLTEYIKHYSTALIEQEPTLNNKKIAELQQTALYLLNDLETLKSDIFTPLKIINYIHIIRHIITLSLQSLEEMSKFTESSQDVIRDYLAQLKYIVLPQLFGLVDKIEVNSMLKPGTLSTPLMNEIKPWYRAMIDFISKPVDFRSKGAELVHIEDARFLALRFDQAYQRIDDAHKELFKIEQAEIAVKNFMDLLKDPQNQQTELNKFPPEAKALLRKNYKVFKQYLFQVNADLHAQIMQQLNEAPSGFLDWAKNLFSFTKKTKTDILNSEQKLLTWINKKKNTQLFHCSINTQMIQTTQQESDLRLFPYNDTTSILTLDELEKTDLIVFPSLNERPRFKIDEKALLHQDEEDNQKLLYAIQNANNVVINPDALSTDQNIILYQWYKKKHEHFILAKKAFIEFHELLTKEIKNHPNIPVHILQLSHLSTESRQQCHHLYLIFREYFLDALPKESQELANKFDNLLKEPPSATNFYLAAPAIEEFAALEKEISPFFDTIDSSWLKKSDFYLKRAKQKLAKKEQNVFRIDEARALRDTKQYDPTIQFKKEKSKKTIKVFEQLSADQALTLHQWYKNKGDKFEVARKAYNQFIELFCKEQTNTLELRQLDDDAKAQCRKLYHLFQPYFINGVPEERRDEALIFDRYIVNMLTDDTLQEETIPPNLFATLHQHFQIFFSDTDFNWRQRGLTFLKYAKEQFARENDQKELQQEPYEERAYHLIKHKEYSKHIKSFRVSVTKMISLFNQSMQAELTTQDKSLLFTLSHNTEQPEQEKVITTTESQALSIKQMLNLAYEEMKKNDVPFPELEDDDIALRQSKQILAIKQIVNTLYRLEKVMLQLENLSDKSSKTMYMIYLSLAGYHFYKMMELTKSLSEDPHFTLIGQELFNKARNIWASIQENIEAYQTAAKDVSLDGTVKVNALWYVLNAFYIGPRHIRSLKDNTYFTSEELEALQRSAKKAALTIERVIESSDSYFKLFLQTPEVIRLYREATSKMTEFISTIHDSTQSNLDKFNQGVFIPMLNEADGWEKKLGLVPGTFSGPTKKILDEFYKGLLHPLHLPSKKHLQLICDKTAINYRIEKNTQEIQSTQEHLDQVEQEYATIKTLHELIEQYQQLPTPGFMSAKPEKTIQEIEQKIIECYKKTHPQLIRLKKQLAFTAKPELAPNDVAFDARLNAALKEYSPKIDDIQRLVRRSYNEYCRQHNSHTMQLNTLKEHLNYVQGLHAFQDQKNEQFIHDYTTESFNKYLDKFSNRHIGLQYVDREFSARLRNYLLTFKDDIILQAKAAEDINKSVRQQLKQRISAFEKVNYAQYYQLDSIQGALTQFKAYFSISAYEIERGNSLFENEDTLAKKIELINNLTLLSENMQLSIEQRIANIKKVVVADPRFKRIILSHKKVDTFSVAYLKLCILSLLEALHLYTPDKKARLTQLTTVVEKEPQLTDLSKRFGLFAKKAETPLAEQTKQQNDNSKMTPP